VEEFLGQVGRELLAVEDVSQHFLVDVGGVHHLLLHYVAALPLVGKIDQPFGGQII